MRRDNSCCGGLLSHTTYPSASSKRSSYISARSLLGYQACTAAAVTSTMPSCYISCGAGGGGGSLLMLEINTIFHVIPQSGHSFGTLHAPVWWTTRAQISFAHHCPTTITLSRDTVGPMSGLSGHLVVFFYFSSADGVMPATISSGTSDKVGSCPSNGTMVRAASHLGEMK